MADLQLQDKVSTGAPRRRFDPWLVGAALFFVVAAALSAAPALKAGPTTLAGLLLLLGVSGVVVLGLVAIRGSALSGGDADQAEGFIEALSEPASLAAADGRVLAANGPWREVMGEQRRLPKGVAGSSLFAALVQARKGEMAEGVLSAGGVDYTAKVSRLAGGRLLIRLSPVVVAETAAEDASPAPVAERAAPPPSTLDAFAGASPFGAALLEGVEPFTSRVLETNPALTTMTGAKPGVVFGDLIDAASRAEAETRLNEGRAGPYEVRLARDPARIAHLYLYRAEGRLVAYMIDVSEQKQIELQLAQAQKMQAIGQLAGGVAHDFNNLLTAIQLRLDELLHRHPVGDPSYEGLNEIRQTGVRAADLVRKLLAFSRKQTVQREVLDLGELISEFEVLLRRLLREDVKLITDYGRDLPQVRADKSQLETAVMNLAVNARDAVRAAKGGGVVRIRTARLTRDEAIQLGFPAADGDTAFIEVSDDGPGIPPDVMGKIFDPFFTTKPVGEGTGLGLATVYGIVKQSDGWIHVHSRPNEGAAFRIFLPVYEAPAGAVAAEVAAEPAKPRAARDLSGAGRILFVEDEDAVRSVAARLLRARGYEVLEAADGEEALLIAEENAGTIDLLISDVIMPGIDGPTLLKKARGYLGTAPVMFISGYAEAEFSDLLEGETGVTFLPKPIDIKTLAERVKQQLQAA
ncbi:MULTISPECIES: cell cycle histidine kinase CckA [unclassified Caulobacter]|uniref:cell cycle histidine kinase CckA n=1 Tax=unclassified Caulobacter TaxID=2648921 RepID=UPI000785BF6E|nr:MULTISPECIES: cell cycle histidine kinase CckA [unclassified Caulobacter]AZS22220.1 response regulator [Caulobacter sp. FWC26]